MATPNFDSLVRAVEGVDWPVLEEEQRKFLLTCPCNKSGWHYFQIPSGPVVHYKTGVVRNPSVPYHIVKVAGLRVLALIGHYRSSDDRVRVCRYEGETQIFVEREGKRIWMPESWEPIPGVWGFYRRFFPADYYFEADRVDKQVLWVAQWDCTWRESPLRDAICHPMDSREQWVRWALGGRGGSMDLETAMYLERAVSRYVRFMANIRTQIRHLNGW